MTFQIEFPISAISHSLNNMLSGLKYARKRVSTFTQERFFVDNTAYTPMFIHYFYVKNPYMLKFFNECGSKLPLISHALLPLETEPVVCDNTILTLEPGCQTSVAPTDSTDNHSIVFLYWLLQICLSTIKERKNSLGSIRVWNVCRALQPLSSPHTFDTSLNALQT